MVESEDFTIVVSGEMSTESSNYTGSGDTTKSEAIVELAAEDFGMYSIDMSMLADGLLSIEWFVPEGKCIELVVPTTYDHVQLAYEWELGDNDMGTFVPSGTVNPELIFTGLSGTATLREQLVLYRDNGLEAHAFSDLVPGETVRFESVMFSVGIEESVDKVYSNLTDSFLRLRATASQTTSMSTPADAGQWLRVVDKDPPVVDPNIALKSTLSRKVKKLNKRVAKLRKKGKTKAVKRLKKKIRKLKKRIRSL